MHSAPGVHWILGGLMLQSALDGSGDGGVSMESEAPLSREAAPAPHAAPAAASPQATRVADDGRLRACQVPGCKSAPMAARTYLGRCRLCVPHMRADEVQLESGGELLRFCQKCVAPRGPRAPEYRCPQSCFGFVAPTRSILLA